MTLLDYALYSPDGIKSSATLKSVTGASMTVVAGTDTTVYQSGTNTMILVDYYVVASLDLDIYALGKTPVEQLPVSVLVSTSCVLDHVLGSMIDAVAVVGKLGPSGTLVASFVQLSATSEGSLSVVSIEAPFFVWGLPESVISQNSLLVSDVSTATTTEFYYFGTQFVKGSATLTGLTSDANITFDTPVVQLLATAQVSSPSNIYSLSLTPTANYSTFTTNKVAIPWTPQIPPRDVGTVTLTNNNQTYPFVPVLLLSTSGGDTLDNKLTNAKGRLPDPTPFVKTPYFYAIIVLSVIILLLLIVLIIIACRG
jgi:hypothetical protein